MGSLDPDILHMLSTLVGRLPRYRAQLTALLPAVSLQPVGCSPSFLFPVSRSLILAAISHPSFHLLHPSLYSPPAIPYILSSTKNEASLVDMAPLLKSSRIPLWAVIVVIAAGSLFVLGAVVCILRCLYVCNVRKQGQSLIGADVPTRKVTIRRGRVVPSSNHLSLTGSKFGVGAFDQDVETAENAVGGGRSRSPFEWWATIRDRSQSRQGEMTQVGSLLSHSQDIPRSSGQGYKSSTLREYEPPRPESTITTTPPKRQRLIKPTSQDQQTVTNRPNRATNFSRNLPSYRSNEYPPSPRTQRLESLAEENDDDVNQSSLWDHRTEGSRSVSTTELPSFYSLPLPALNTPPTSSLNNTHSFLSSTSTISLPSQRVGRSAPNLTLPEPVRLTSQPGTSSQLRNTVRRSSSTLSETSLTYRQPEQMSRRSSTNDPPTAQEEVRHSKSVQELRNSESLYWDSRPDLTPVRRPSKKGKVLRKKSLKRADMVARVS